MNKKEIEELELKVETLKREFQQKLSAIDKNLISKIKVGRGFSQSSDHFSDWHDNWHDGPRWSKSWGKAGGEAVFNFDNLENPSNKNPE